MGRDQLAAIEAGGSVLVRLAKCELAADDGQLHFDFEAPGEEPPATLRLVQGPTTKAEWHALGVEQEQGGYFAEAVESYRDALLAGGPDPQLVFDLARALHQLGKLDEAAERYRQVVEMDPKFDDAWNNLGVLLVQRDMPNEACEAFRRALDANPDNAMSHYNLADTLDEAGRLHEAADHWRAYLKTDAQSERAAYARRRLG